MAYISKLTIGGVTYDIYDAEVREMVSKVLVFAGVTTATITDGGSTPSTYAGLTGIPTPYPINPATGQPHAGTDTLDAGTVVIDGGKEFVWDGTKWVEFGDLSDLSLSPTWGNYVTSVTATPTNSATNTGAGTAHSHTVSASSKVLTVTTDATKHLVTASQTAPTVQSSVALGTVQSTSSGAGAGVITALTSNQKLVTTPMIDWLQDEASVAIASAGSAINAFTTINATSSGGIKIITDVSGGGTAGSVTTTGVAASLQTTVVTGLATSNATATGRIAYVAGVTSTNKLVTLQTTPASVGTAFNYVNGYSNTYSLGGNQIPFVAAATNMINGHTLQKTLQSVSLNNDGTSTYTLTIASEVALGTLGDGSWGMTQAVFPTFTVSYLTFASATPAVAGTQITYATGQLAANGSGSAVATGGTTSYLYANTGSQTTNTPTAVSFNTITLTGTPSYIHTTPITPAIANGTIPRLTHNGEIHLATGALSTTGSGANVVTGGTTSYLTLGSQTSGSIVTTIATGALEVSGTGAAVVTGATLTSADGGAGITYIYSVGSTTGQESAHTHSYSKTTAISVSAPTASALASVTLVPAS